MSENGKLKPTNGIRKPGAAKKEAEKQKNEKNRQASASSANGKQARGLRIKKNYSDGKFSRKKSVPIVIGAIVILIAVTIFSAMLSYTYLVDKYENPISEDSIVLDEATKVTFKITKGSNSTKIAKDLAKKDLISSRIMYKLLSKFNGYDGKYKAGTHYLSKGLSYDEIMVLLSSEPETVKVTFPEGFNIAQMAERLEKNNVVKKDTFLKAINTIDLSSYSFITPLVEGQDYRLEGYLFPDTYVFDIESDAEAVIYKMLNNFNDRYLPEYYEKADELGLNIKQVITLASIVEKEAKLTKESKIIAGVFINRINNEDYLYLQSNATLSYIYRKMYGETVEKFDDEFKKTDDPYNTYLYEGLPPGPICNPSLASIKAVLNYETTDYYYFVVSKDNPKAHVFSKTLEEHKKAVAENEITAQ